MEYLGLEINYVVTLIIIKNDNSAIAVTKGVGKIGHFFPVEPMTNVRFLLPAYLVVIKIFNN